MKKNNTGAGLNAIIKEYYSLAKVGLVMGNMITVIAGFALASRGVRFDWELFIATCVGIFLVMASGCVFNNYIDRDIDGHMERTKDRALVAHRVSKRGVLIFGIALGILGFLTLALWTSAMALLFAALGFVFYVGAYTLWGKRHSVYGTFIGAIAGAVPPVVGYCAVSDRFDIAALILFLIMVVWQMPHFFAIAIRREHDYAAAGIPVMPVVAGVQRTKISMLVYIVEFTIAASLLALFGYAGYWYLAIAIVLGVVWLAVGIKGIKKATPAADVAWARSMFLLSLVVMVTLFATITIASLV